MGVDIKNQNLIFNFLDHIYSSFFPGEHGIECTVIVEDFVRFTEESSIIEISIGGISIIMPAAIMV